MHVLCFYQGNMGSTPDNRRTSKKVRTKWEIERLSNLEVDDRKNKFSKLWHLLRSKDS